MLKFRLDRPNNHVTLDPISNSPLMQRLGYTQNEFTRLGQHLTSTYNHAQKRSLNDVIVM